MNAPSVRILSAFASLIPLIVNRVFFGVKATASIVFNPASCSFFVSDAEIPASCDVTVRHLDRPTGKMKGLRTHLKFRN